MIDYNRFELCIGFDAVRSRLRELCVSDLGLERVESMSISTDVQTVREQLLETTEMMTLLPHFRLNEFADERMNLKHLRVEGSVIETVALWNVQEVLRLLLSYCEQLLEDSETTDDAYPTLRQQLNETIEENVTAVRKVWRDLVRKIEKILDENGEVRDDASPELSRVRKSLRSLEGEARSSVHALLRKAQGEGYVSGDVSVSMRDGHYVIPLGAGVRRKMTGVVRDVSDSGQTFYVEPLELVELSARGDVLRDAERREIHRILQEISAVLRPEVDGLLRGYTLLGMGDFISAKARLATEMKGVMPQLTSGAAIDWVDAVHPLLQQRLEAEGRRVVPLNVKLEAPSSRILLISGPNAGGKSVCLKTVGLLQYMLQCGLLVPMNERSVCGIFGKLMIDIGDEQDLGNDLSTYSSHLLRMKEMLREGNGETLVLIDEFGGGTEPQIGGAMAQAILHRLNEQGVWGIITTHYQVLKVYAEETEGLINGAMLYDRGRLQPLFELSIGHAGSSFALEIAKKMGLDDALISEARELVGEGYANADKWLLEVARDKRYWQQKRAQIHDREKKREALIAELEERLAHAKEERKEILAKAKADAEQLLQEANARIERTIREIREADAEKARTKAIREELKQFGEQLKPKAEAEAPAKKNAPKGKKKRPAAAAKAVKQTPIAVGDVVKISGQQATGHVLRLAKGQAFVAFGSLQTYVPVEKLEHAVEHTTKRSDTFLSRETQNSIRETSLQFKSELNVIGMRADEAVQAVTYFLDDALISNAKHLRIVHGTGTGALKVAIRQYLSTQGAVESIREEHPQFGGAGVTLVDLK